MSQRGRPSRSPPPVVQPDVPPHAPAPTTQEFFELLRDYLRVDNQGANPPVNNENRAREQSLQRFLGFQPPRFLGTTDDRVAEIWISEIEKIFRVQQTTDPEKVEFAVYLLQGPAEVWWKATEERWIATGIVATWDEFVREFRAKYIPQVIQDQREREFMNLSQGSSSVVEYEANFSRLAVFAPHIASDERRKSRKFLEGLELSLRRGLAGFQLETYTAAVDRALKLESEYHEIDLIASRSSSSTGSLRPSEQSTSEPTKRPSEPSTSEPTKRSCDQSVPEPDKEKKRKTRKKKKSTSTGVRQPNSHTTALCGFCKKRHSEAKCWMRLGYCLTCGSPTHQVGKCPKRQNQRQSGLAKTSNSDV